MASRGNEREFSRRSKSSRKDKSPVSPKRARKDPDVEKTSKSPREASPDKKGKAGGGKSSGPSPYDLPAFDATKIPGPKGRKHPTRVILPKLGIHKRSGTHGTQKQHPYKPVGSHGKKARASDAALRKTPAKASARSGSESTRSRTTGDHTDKPDGKSGSEDGDDELAEDGSLHSGGSYSSSDELGGTTSSEDRENDTTHRDPDQQSQQVHQKDVPTVEQADDKKNTNINGSERPNDAVLTSDNDAHSVSGPSSKDNAGDNTGSKITGSERNLQQRDSGLGTDTDQAKPKEEGGEDPDADREQLDDRSTGKGDDGDDEGSADEDIGPLEFKADSVSKDNQSIVSTGDVLSARSDTHSMRSSRALSARSDTRSSLSSTRSDNRSVQSHGLHSVKSGSRSTTSAGSRSSLSTRSTKSSGRTSKAQVEYENPKQKPKESSKDEAEVNRSNADQSKDGATEDATDPKASNSARKETTNDGAAEAKERQEPEGSSTTQLNAIPPTEGDSHEVSSKGASDDETIKTLQLSAAKIMQDTTSIDQKNQTTGEHQATSENEASDQTQSSSKPSGEVEASKDGQGNQETDMEKSLNPVQSENKQEIRTAGSKSQAKQSNDKGAGSGTQRGQRSGETNSSTRVPAANIKRQESQSKNSANNAQLSYKANRVDRNPRNEVNMKKASSTPKLNQKATNSGKEETTTLRKVASSSKLDEDAAPGRVKRVQFPGSSKLDIADKGQGSRSAAVNSTDKPQQKKSDAPASKSSESSKPDAKQGSTNAESEPVQTKDKADNPNQHQGSSQSSHSTNRLLNLAQKGEWTIMDQVVRSLDPRTPHPEIHVTDEVSRHNV